MSQTQTTKRLLMGSGAQALGMAARIAEQLLMVPILLAAWSVGLYGEWLVIAAIPVYLMLSDLGFVTSGSNELARRAQEGISAQTHRYFQDYTWLFAKWSLLVFLVILAVAIWLPLDRVFNLDLMPQAEARWAFILLIASALVSQNSLTLVAGLRAKRQFHIALGIKSSLILLRILCIALAVSFLDSGPAQVALITLILQIVDYLALFVVLQRQGFSPGLHLIRRHLEPMWPTLKTGFEYLLLPLSQAIALQGMILAIGFTMGATAVAVFATHRTLSRVVSQFVHLGVSPLHAELGLLQGEHNKTQVRRLLTSVSRLTFWGSIVTAGALTLIGKPLFETWTSGEISYHLGLFLLLLGGTLVEGIWRVSATLRLGTNRHRPVVWGYLVISNAGLLLTLGLVGSLGILGAGVPVLGMELAMFALVIIVNQPLIGISAPAFLAAIARPPTQEILQLRKIIKARRAS